MAVDLGTAYISVVPTTKDLDKGIRQALDKSVKHADKAGRDMGEQIAQNVTKQVGKAGDRSGEAFSRGFGPRVQSAGRSALQGLSNLLVGGAQGIGGELGGGISAGMTTAINKGAVEAIDSLSAIGTRGGAAMSSKLQTAGMLAAGGVALVGTAAIAATAELYKIGAAWDDISDGITAKTGLIGAELAKVTDSVKRVALDTAAAPGDIARVTADLVQTLKLSGEDLEILTKQISDYNEMNKDAPINVREFAKAMKQFGITSAQDMSDTLDRLNNVAQNTGIPLNSLISSLRSAAPVAREFKMPLEEVTQLLATFEDAGLNAESAATLLKLALGNLAKANPNEDPVVALQNVITEIQNLSNAGRDLEAIDLAKSTFGRSWDQILPLIKENKLEVDNLNTATAALGPTIEEQRKATADFAEEWRKFRNFLEVELAPAAEVVFNGISTIIKGTLGVAAQNIRDIRDAWNSVSGGGGGDAPAMIPGGGGPNASRERRGLPPVDTGLLGGGFAAPPTGGMSGSPGRGFPMPNRFGGLIGNAGGAVTGASAPAGGAESWRPAVRSALAQYGPGLGITNYQAWEDALVRQIATESGGNPAAHNPNDSDGRGGRQTVSGLLQFLPSTFAAHNITGGAYTDPMAQIPAAIDYVMSKYGVDANGAPLQIGRGVGYDTGGWLPPGATNVVNNTGKDELILNPEQVQELARQGLDPNSLLHGTTNKAAPGPTQAASQSMDTVNRTGGFVPVAAGNTGVAGTSFVSSVLNLGNEAVSGAIDAGAQLAQMAAAAAAAVGTAGAGAGASPAAGPAASAGIQIAANIAKRASAFGFQMAGIGADSLIAQLFPFGAPRWLGYDYTAFTPQMGMGNVGVTTLERAQLGQNPGGPVNPEQMPGAQQPITIENAANPAPPPPGVMSNQQIDALTQNLPEPGNAAPMVKIDNIYGFSAQDVAGQIESKQKLAMMRYAGRP